MPTDGPPLTIGVVPRANWIDALRLLVAHERPEVQIAEVDRVVRGLLNGRLSPAGLVEARRGHELVGVARGEVISGNVGIVCGLGIAGNEPVDTARELLHALQPFFQNASCSLLQCLGLTALEDSQDAILGDVGFHRASDLVYLACLSEHFPSDPPAGRLGVEVYRDEFRPRFEQTILQTYEETLDFPVLNFRRPIVDVMDGYLATGEFDPQNWLLFSDDEGEAGCVLVNRHANSHSELVYMGLVKRARGRGYGNVLVGWALWLARQAHSEQLITGVDAANEPALRAYRRCGFVDCERRPVYLKFV